MWVAISEYENRGRIEIRLSEKKLGEVCQSFEFDTPSFLCKIPQTEKLGGNLVVVTEKLVYNLAVITEKLGCNLAV